MSDAVRALSTRFDGYSRAARLRPALLVLLGPLSVSAGVGIAASPLVTALATAASALGLSYVLSEWVRRRGQALQEDLWAKWGGGRVALALKSLGLVAEQRRRRLAAATLLPVDHIDHPEFDNLLDNAISRLITATRDTSRYKLVFVENKAYGFARNILAIRQVGVAVSALSVGCGAISVLFGLLAGTPSVLGALAGMTGAVLALLFWWTYPSEQRVIAAGNDYATRLLEALDAGALRPEDD